MPPSTRKVNKVELGALLYQRLDLEENDTTEKKVPPVDSIEQDASMLINSATAKYASLDDLRSILSTNFKNNPDRKYIDNEAYTPKKKIVLDGSALLYINKHTMCYVPKVDIVHNHSLIYHG